ncbi:MAG TPA: heavy metal translocating P-type ATPase [Bryobacteraceae bacterium]|nr:heavy metal translocating P-type ATPase [Bryobacteraceae bacterium]
MTAAGIACGLCGLDCGRHPVTRRIGGEERSFCCTGCMHVYQILAESGVLASGQDFRESEVYRQSLKLGLIANPEAGEREPAAAPAAEVREAMFQVGGMWCSACGWLIEHVLERERGVVSAEVFFASDLMKVRYCPQYVPPGRIAGRLAELGYRASEYTGQNEGESEVRKDLLLRTGVAAFLWLNVMTFSMVLYVGYFQSLAESIRQFLPFVLLALATPAVFYSAAPVLRLSVQGLRHGAIRMETLLALGILAAYGYSAAGAFRGGRHFYFDTACAIVTLVLAGKLVEQGAKEKTSRAITLLYRMMPKKARVRTDGRERFVSVEALAAGVVFVVQPGERIPADGVVVEGRSHVDESVLTGESAPRARGPGEAVICGSVNGGGVLEVRTTHAGAESTLARIIRSVEAALASRSRIERQVDRVSRIFVPAVIGVALATFAWLLPRAGFPEALLRAITVLVIACPCALGIATPLAMTSAIGAAARRHILVTHGQALETVRRVTAAVLDKTGTVTEGNFELLETAGETGRLPLVAALEAYSPHPLARALCRRAEELGWAGAEAREIEIREGAGIRGVVAGREVFAGNHRICPAPPPAALAEQAAAWEREGHTVVFFGSGDAVEGALCFGDRIKREAAAVVGELKRRGVRTLLVSGDARAATAWVAGQIGVDEMIAEALPEQKVHAIRALQQGGAVVAMIGDGVNDAPSLAQADLGIALGSGTDIAIQAAPVVITSGRLEPVLETFEVARRTVRVIRQNLFWAFLYNAAAITLAVTGTLNPIMAAGAMVLSSISVIWNSSRLSRAGPPIRTATPRGSPD